MVEGQRPLLEGGDNLWALLEKHKFFSQGDIAVYQKCHHSFLHWRWACLVPSVLCTIWLLAKPDKLIGIVGDKDIAYFGIAILIILLFWHIARRVIGTLIVNEQTFCKAIEDFEPKSHEQRPASCLLFGWIEYESLLWLLMAFVLPGAYPGELSIFITMPSFFLLVISTPLFDLSLIWNKYATELIETLHVRIQKCNARNATGYADILKQVRVLRKTLVMLYSSGMVYNAVMIFFSTITTIACAVFSVAVAANCPANSCSNGGMGFVIAAAFVSIFYGYNTISLLLALAKISDACMCPTAGLLGAVLEHGDSVDVMPQTSILQFQALKDEFRFAKFGTKVGIDIDKTVISTAVAGHLAALYSFVFHLWHVLQN